VSRTAPPGRQAAHAEREAFDRAFAPTYPELLQAAQRELRQSQVQDGKMLFFIYWCVVLDPATWSPDSVPLQRDQD
jgi:hypothetical protein